MTTTQKYTHTFVKNTGIGLFTLGLLTATGPHGFANETTDVLLTTVVIPDLPKIVLLSEERRQLAITADDDVRNAFSREDFDAALTAANRAYELFPNAYTALVRAITLAQMKRHNESFAAYLLAASLNPTKAEKIQIDDGLKQQSLKCTPPMGWIQIDSVPVSTVIVFEHRRRTPVWIGLPQEAIQVRFEEVGYLPLTATVSATPGQAASSRFGLLKAPTTIASNDLPIPPEQPTARPRPQKTVNHAINLSLEGKFRTYKLNSPFPSISGHPLQRQASGPIFVGNWVLDHDTTINLPDDTTILLKSGLTANSVHLQSILLGTGNQLAHAALLGLFTEVDSYFVFSEHTGFSLRARMAGATNVSDAEVLPDHVAEVGLETLFKYIHSYWFYWAFGPAYRQHWEFTGGDPTVVVSLPLLVSHMGGDLPISLDTSTRLGWGLQGYFGYDAQVGFNQDGLNWGAEFHMGLTVPVSHAMSFLTRIAGSYIQDPLDGIAHQLDFTAWSLALRLGISQGF